jgi:hypothetical protein
VVMVHQCDPKEEEGTALVPPVLLVVLVVRFLLLLGSHTRDIQWTKSM